jgi:hypothetical protein
MLPDGENKPANFEIEDLTALVDEEIESIIVEKPHIFYHDAKVAPLDIIRLPHKQIRVRPKKAIEKKEDEEWPF